MSYGETKSKNFAKYCKEGKMHLVKKWIDNPNVDINWNKHSPLRYSIKTNQIESIKLLLQNSKLKTDYENDNRPLKGPTGIINPFTEAMTRKNFEVLDIFIKSKKFKVERIEHLDILLSINDEELNDYFKKIDGFESFILNSGDEYVKIVSADAAAIFLF